MDEVLFLISLLNALLLIALIAGIIRWQYRHGRISEKRLALILLGYFSYSFISLMVPIFLSNPGVITLTIIGFLVLLWGLEYPFIRWLYRLYHQPK